MKKLILSLTISLVAFAGYNAAAQTIIPGAFNFSATVEEQALEGIPAETTTGTATKSTSVTNYITSADATLAKSFTLNDKALLTLLGNSLSSPFPAGSALVIDDTYTIYVNYKGTNTSVSSVLTLTPKVSLYSGKEKVTETVTTKVTTKSTNTTTKVTGGEALTETIAGKLNYDDSALGLGTTNTFSVYGIAKAAFDSVAGLDVSTNKGSFTVTGGVGAGMISNTPCILSGVSISGSYVAKGVPN